MSSILEGIGKSVSSYAKGVVLEGYDEDIRIINSLTILYNVVTITTIAFAALAVSYGSILCLFAAGIVFVARFTLDEVIRGKMGKITTALGLIGQQNAQIGGESYLVAFRRMVHVN